MVEFVERGAEIDCSKLPTERKRHICMGVDGAGEPIKMSKIKRMMYISRWFDLEIDHSTAVIKTGKKVSRKPCGCNGRRKKMNAVVPYSGDLLAFALRWFGASKIYSSVTEKDVITIDQPKEAVRDPDLTTTWSYGITTVPSRFGKEFDRTVNSLCAAGFSSPVVFVDGPMTEDVDYAKFGHPVVYREKNMKTCAHWYLTAVELYLRDAKADFYAIFQDDLIAYRNLRQYIEQSSIPEKGYLNLYTFPVNQTIANKILPSGEDGWVRTNQKGKGAVALVFSNEAMKTLLKQDYLVSWFHKNNKRRGVDACVIESMQEAGLSEFAHSPSLVQHTGKRSSMGNKRSPNAPKFRGEEYDATLMLK